MLRLLTQLEFLAAPNVQIAAHRRAGVALNGICWCGLLGVVSGGATRKRRDNHSDDK